MMCNIRILVLHIIFPFSLVIAIPVAYGWGYDGHIAVCRIAQARLSKVAAQAVRKLLPASAENDLGIFCPWPDRVRMRYPWSSDLHFINTPDRLCSYKYTRDCKDRNGAKGRCLTGAINNYTTQLLSYKKFRSNLTEALLFLSHFMGDVHQPLHVGFASDRGGNTVKVTWFNRKRNLHRVWDSEIIIKAEGRSEGASLNSFIRKIQYKIKYQWGNQVNKWAYCGDNRKITCTDMYAEESIKAACNWAYKGVHSGSVLKDNYYKTRLPIVELRLAQAGVRLGATLNRIFR